MRRLIATLAGTALLATAAAAKMVEVTVEGMLLDPTTGSPVVRLVEKPATGSRELPMKRELPIWIGPFEAQAIALELQGVPPPRPLTHDLMKQIVERLGGKLERVEITDLRDGTYFATVLLHGPGGKGLHVDSRPSDAIALALRLRGPIFVEEEVFAKSAVSRATPASAHLWGLTVQDLTPEIASFFATPDAHGVLVADVEAKAAAAELVRGDVIVGLDDEPVQSVEQLTSRAGQRAADDPVRLDVRRGGRALRVRFRVE